MEKKNLEMANRTKRDRERDTAPEWEVTEQGGGGAGGGGEEKHGDRRPQAAEESHEDLPHKRIRTTRFKPGGRTRSKKEEEATTDQGEEKKEESKEEAKRSAVTDSLTTTTTTPTATKARKNVRENKTSRTHTPRKKTDARPKQVATSTTTLTTSTTSTMMSAATPPQEWNFHDRLGIVRSLTFSWTSDQEAKSSEWLTAMLRVVARGVSSSKSEHVMWHMTAAITGKPYDELESAKEVSTLLRRALSSITERPRGALRVLMHIIMSGPRLEYWHQWIIKQVVQRQMTRDKIATQWTRDRLDRFLACLPFLAPCASIPAFSASPSPSSSLPSFSLSSPPTSSLASSSSYSSSSSSSSSPCIPCASSSSSTSTISCSKTRSATRSRPRVTTFTSLLAPPSSPMKRCFFPTSMSSPSCVILPDVLINRCIALLQPEEQMVLSYASSTLNSYMAHPSNHRFFITSLYGNANPQLTSWMRRSLDMLCSPFPSSSSLSFSSSSSTSSPSLSSESSSSSSSSSSSVATSACTSSDVSRVYCLLPELVSASTFGIRALSSRLFRQESSSSSKIRLRFPKLLYLTRTSEHYEARREYPGYIGSEYASHECGRQVWDMPSLSVRLVHHDIDGLISNMDGVERRPRSIRPEFTRCLTSTSPHGPTSPWSVMIVPYTNPLAEKAGEVQGVCISPHSHQWLVIIQFSSNVGPGPDIHRILEYVGSWVRATRRCQACRLPAAEDSSSSSATSSSSYSLPKAGLVLVLLASKSQWVCTPWWMVVDEEKRLRDDGIPIYWIRADPCSVWARFICSQYFQDGDEIQHDVLCHGVEAASSGTDVSRLVIPPTVFGDRDCCPRIRRLTTGKSACYAYSMHDLYGELTSVIEPQLELQLERQRQTGKWVCMNDVSSYVCESSTDTTTTDSAVIK